MVNSSDNNKGIGQEQLIALMKQTATMQMQMAAAVCATQVGLAQALFQIAFPGARLPQPQPQQHAGFKLGTFEIPPELLATVMQLDMSPEHLEKLQKVLDTVLPLMTPACPNKQ